MLQNKKLTILFFFFITPFLAFTEKEENKELLISCQSCNSKLMFDAENYLAALKKENKDRFIKTVKKADSLTTEVEKKDKAINNLKNKVKLLSIKKVEKDTTTAVVIKDTIKKKSFWKRIGIVK